MDTGNNTRESSTTTVKSFPLNPWGLYGMHGNVWECCKDAYNDYDKTPSDDKAGAARVVRGGSWGDGARLCRSACRGRIGPSVRGYRTGFRCARVQSDDENGVLPGEGPPPLWASDSGKDVTGAWAEFTVLGNNGMSATQRMRWIPPGSFLMGSPETEAGRDNDEKQHEVTIEEGFWLADTACTQALWEAVMKSNPSFFKGSNLPVENVSWNDAQAFMAELNRRIPGLGLSLPTEAQWEYACRAGTTTAFSFGDNLTDEQANQKGGYTPNSSQTHSFGKDVDWTHKIISGVSCSNEFADTPSCLLIEIDNRGVNQIAKLYEKLLESVEFGTDKIVAHPSNGVSCLWTDDLSDGDTEGAELANIEEKDLPLNGGEQTLDFNKTSGENSIESERLCIYVEGFGIEALAKYDDAVYCTPKIYWSQVPDLAGAIKAASLAMSGPGSEVAFTEFDWLKKKDELSVAGRQSEAIETNQNDADDTPGM